VFSLAAGFVATQKNRSFFGYFFLSIFITPIISFLILIAVPKKELHISSSYVDHISGKYTRAVFDQEFSEEWKTLTKYDDELRAILSNIFENVSEKNEKAKIIDELKKVYKIKKEVEMLSDVSKKLISQYKENGTVFN